MALLPSSFSPVLGPLTPFRRMVQQAVHPISERCTRDLQPVGLGMTIPVDIVVGTEVDMPPGSVKVSCPARVRPAHPVGRA